MPNWEKEDVRLWKKDAREQQLLFYEKLGDRRWDFIEKKDWVVLQRRVGYALCGPPQCEDNACLGYSEEQ
uniref:Uncharacterized protein n=1 Tax=Plectus sambesii TaxID=2011161 RepID=A0A914WQT6_9BILA